MPKRIYHTCEPEARQREGLPEQPAIWEDARRTEAQPGFFERWQFDARFTDGSLVTITFFTNPMLERSAPLKPGVSITIVPPGGKPLGQAISIAEEDFSASKERCYVRAGESWVRGDQQWRYELHVKAGSLSAHLEFQGVVPPWRPGAGKFYAGEAGTGTGGTGSGKYFAWLAGIPYGTVEGMLTYDGKIHPVKGFGYHDHRWGSLALHEAFDHWYLGRARAGEFTLLFLEITTSAAFGGQKIPAYMLAHCDQLISANCANLDLIEQEFQPDPGGRSYPSGLSGRWVDGEQTLLFNLRDPLLIDSFSLVDFLPTWKRLVGGLLANPYQFNFTSDLEVQVNTGGIQAREEGQALYELVLF